MKGPIPTLVANCLLGFGLLVSTSALAQVNVLTYHNDNGRTGQNLNETILTPANVNQATFGKLFSYPVDGHVYAQPLYVSHVAIPGQGTHNILFIATQHDSVYAFDADSTTAGTNGLLWKVSLGTSAVTPNADFGTRYNSGAYLDITPEVGITGTPAIDLATGTLYVDAFTHEGASYFHRIHALNITNGTEQANSPVLVNVSVNGTGVGSVGGKVPLTHKQHLQRSALTLVNGILYVVYAGYADTNPYHGWVVGFDAGTLQQLTNQVFNTTPNSTTAGAGANAGEGGIWMGDGGMGVDANNNLYFMVGNGVFNANTAGGTEYGDSFVKLSTSNQLAVADYFTPYNQATLAVNDTDLGSGGLVVLPDQPGIFPHLMVGAGKEGKIYLVNRDQLTTGNIHYDAAASTDHVVQVLTGQITRSASTPAYFNGRLYYGGWADRLKAFSLVNGLLSTTPVSAGTRTNAFPGSTPSVSANGTSNGIIWTLSMGSPAVLVANNATNLASEIYNSNLAGTRDRLANSVKFNVPTVANGKVYAGAQYAVSVFGTFAGTVAFNSPTYSAPASNGVATITVTRTGGTQGAVQVAYATAPGGTAVTGVNYVATSGVLNWATGDATSKSFTVTLLNGHLGGTNTTVNLALSSPSGGAGVGGQSTASLSIIGGPSGAWRLAHFGTNASNAPIAGDLADPDGDGLVNLLEYALAADPGTFNTNRSLTGALAGNRLMLQFHRNTSATDLTYVVEASNNLQTWAALMTYTAGAGWVANAAGATVSESAPVGVSPDQYVNVTITDPTDVGAPGSGSRFLRLHLP
ncbi:MAG: hypothetical protein JWR69_4486 [Pedosphaera sp.]|nr:hypothetical protein [Pedosphaera sp.]